jgi:hypothetical protein
MTRATKNSNKLRRVDAPLYRYWQALYLALYSGALYVDVAKRWRGFGMLYLLLVVAITMTPFAGQFIYDIHQSIDEQILSPIQKLPLLYIQNGNVEIDQPMPYVIKNKKGDTVVIIDTAGKVKKIIDEHPELRLLVAKNKLYLRNPKMNFFFGHLINSANTKIYVQALNENMNEVFDGNLWVNSSRVKRLKWSILYSLYPMLIMVVYSLTLVIMLPFAFIGKLFSHIVIKHDMPFKTASRVFMVSSTGTIYLFFLSLLFNVSLPGIGIFYMALLSIFFFYGVLCVKRESKKLVQW